MKNSPRLERALEALSRERKHVQKDMSEVAARRSQMTSAMTRLEDCRESVGQVDVFKAGERELDADLFVVTRSAEARMLRELQTLQDRLERFDEEITKPVQERLRVAAVREKAVATLVRRRQDLAERLESRRERRMMDEHAQVRWSARWAKRRK